AGGGRLERCTPGSRGGVEERGTDSIVTRSEQYSMRDAELRRAGLSESTTETQFDNGYWYATELKDFAARIGVPSASRLRKDELEKAIRHFIRNGEVKTFVKRRLTRARVKDVDKGLRLELRVVNYTSNRETKDFIDREA